MIDMFFPINPKPIQSTKFARMGKFTKTYQPKSNTDYKGQIKYLAQKHMADNNLQTITEPVRIVRVEYIFTPPKSWSKKKMKSLTDGNIMYKSTRPDLMDNLNKGLFDALQGTVFSDDSLIVECLLSRKIYGLSPGIHLALEEA